MTYGARYNPGHPYPDTPRSAIGLLRNLNIGNSEVEKRTDLDVKTRAMPQTAQTVLKDAHQMTTTSGCRCSRYHPSAMLT